MRISAMLRSASVGTLTVLGLSLGLPSVSYASTYTGGSPAIFNWTSDECTGGCNPSGTITVTGPTSTLSTVLGTLTFTVSLGDSLQFLSGSSGGGIESSFAYSLANISTISYVTGPTGAAGTTFTAQNTTGGSFHMDGAGTFENFGFGIQCSSCGTGASGPTGGNTLTFSISALGLGLNDLQTSTGTSAFFAADVVSCKTGTTAGCTGTGTGNTGVINATQVVPGPIVGAGLPGLVMACGGLLALARRRRQKIA